MSSICELIDVNKSFDGNPVLEGLNLAIDHGETVAITGRSGSGKSTLLNIVGLLERPDRGRLTLFGETAPHPGSRKSQRLLRSELGYLFQNHALVDTATVEQNLQIAQTYASGTTTQKRARRAEALERVGLAGLERRRVYGLSGGEQQRVAIARLMLKPCSLILADEPTGSLDEQNRDAVLDLLAALTDTAKTMILVTHDPFVAARCSRVVRLTGRDRRPTT